MDAFDAFAPSWSRCLCAESLVPDFLDAFSPACSSGHLGLVGLPVLGGFVLCACVISVVAWLNGGCVGRGVVDGRFGLAVGFVC